MMSNDISTCIANSLFLGLSPPTLYLICSHVRTLIKRTLYTHFCGTVSGSLHPLISKLPLILSPKGPVRLFCLHCHRLYHSPQPAILQSASGATAGTGPEKKTEQDRGEKSLKAWCISH